MVAFFHDWVGPDRSVSQEMGQGDPDLNTSPGPGDTGFMAARAKDGSRIRLRRRWIDIVSEVNLRGSSVGIYCLTLVRSSQGIPEDHVGRVVFICTVEAVSRHVSRWSKLVRIW